MYICVRVIPLCGITSFSLPLCLNLYVSASQTFCGSFCLCTFVFTLCVLFACLSFSVFLTVCVHIFLTLCGQESFGCLISLCVFLFLSPRAFVSECVCLCLSEFFLPPGFCTSLPACVTVFVCVCLHDFLWLCVCVFFIIFLSLLGFTADYMLLCVCVCVVFSVPVCLTVCVCACVSEFERIFVCVFLFVSVSN